MRVIETDCTNPDDLSTFDRDLVYNALDTCITFEVLEAIYPQLDNHTSATYNFARELQGPILEMRCRGVRIDTARKERVIDELFEIMEKLEAQLQTIVGEAFGMWDFKWQGNAKDPLELFYDRMMIPPLRGKRSCDRNALEKLESYFIAMQPAKHIIALRELAKKISMLRTEIDDDGRMRTQYNIAGTTTGRLSSSLSEFGTGTNLQNIEESLRSIFISDPGKKLAYLDAEQGESRVVGAIEWNLFRDARYLDACEGGDLHTTVAKLCWPGLAWTNDLATDRKLAEAPYYRHYDRRFMCKKIGHGSNYAGKPDTLATQAKVERAIIEAFQPLYFGAFPAHLDWHTNVRDRLWNDGHLITLTGRKRWFFGRRNDDSTLREAIAYDPQGSLADILNRGLLNVWRHLCCELLMQVHDAILIQYPEDKEDEIIPLVQAQLRQPILLEDRREFVIPYGCATGWNWGKWDAEKNPDGIKSYKGNDNRQRTPEVGLLGRSFYGVHRRVGKRRGV